MEPRPCLAAGNTCVVKPSELAPLSTIALGEIALEAGLPAGVLNIVTGMGETGTALVAHPGVDAIAFTGGVATGRKVMATAAESLKRVMLELGGKSPNLVFADADLQRSRGRGRALDFSQPGTIVRRRLAPADRASESRRTSSRC